MFIVFSFLVYFILFLQKTSWNFWAIFWYFKTDFFLKIFKKIWYWNLFFSCVISTNFSNHSGKKNSNFWYWRLKRAKKKGKKKTIDPHPQLWITCWKYQAYEMEETWQFPPGIKKWIWMYSLFCKRQSYVSSRDEFTIHNLSN